MIARFLDYELDPSTAELRRRGTVVPLERQPAVALTVLVSRAGRLVPRDDLRRAIWPDDVHVDFDRGMNYCIRQLRAALGDDARRPRFIETVPRQGYRFLAPVIAGQAGLAPAATPSRIGRIAAVAALLAVASGAMLEFHLAAGPRNPRHHAIAVKAVRAVHDVVF